MLELGEPCTTMNVSSLALDCKVNSSSNALPLQPGSTTLRQIVLACAPPEGDTPVPLSAVDVAKVSEQFRMAPSL